MTKPRSDDYVKNMIRRMLVDEGWVREADALTKADPDHALPNLDYRWRGMRIGEPSDPAP